MHIQDLYFKKSIVFILVVLLLLIWSAALSQNIGVGSLTPAGKFHIKGSANTSQLVIDANSTQSNASPLIKLRNSMGADLMWIHTDDSTNIFLGLRSGKNNGTGLGVYNVFIGKEAGFSNSIGDYNIGIGYAALTYNTSGYQNTGVGHEALRTNSTGYNNVAIGFESLITNASGYFNTAVGANSMFYNSSGHNNTAVGESALESNSTGSYNSAVGSSALSFNTNGGRNVAVGFRALFNNINGDANTAIGDNSLYNNNSGPNNVAVGSYSLYYNTGGYNVAMGVNALYSNITGHSNCAVGYHALYYNTGFANTGFGHLALSNSTGASGNTALGYQAGDSYNNSWDNTYVGNGADANGIYNNCIAVGAFATVSANQQARIGFNVTSIGGPQNWTNTSDGRIKNNIREDVHGLDFIKLLRPVTYTKSLQQEMNILGASIDRPFLPDNPYETIRYSGFIAQEVEQAAQSIGYDFSGVDPPKNEKDLYGLRYAEFVVPLVKAVQEQQDQITELKKEIDLLKDQNILLAKLLNQKF